MKPHVLDASAVMAYFEGRPGVDAVAELFKKALAAQGEMIMSVVNWGEVYYSVWGTRGQAVAEAFLVQLGQYPIEVVPADEALARRAAELKATRKLPYADAFAAALAIQRKAAVVTTDADFERVEKDVTVVWAQKT